MKTKLFTAALLLALTLTGQAQDKQSLKAATQKMLDLTNQENFGDLTGTVYPKVFNMTSKEDYLNKIEKTMKGKDYTIHMIRIDPSIDYGSIKRTDNGFFCLVTYSSMMTIEFTGKIEPKDREARENYFKQLLGTEDVYYIENNNTIDVKKRTQVVAINDDSSYNQWTFIDPKNPIAMEILDEVIRRELDPENTEAAPEASTSQQATQNDKWTNAKKAEEEKKKSVQKKS